MKAKLKNDAGIIKEVKVGFSWTVFFFSFFVPLIRGDFKWAAIMFLISLLVGYFGYGLTAFIVGIIFSFMYNKLYTKELLSKGYYPLSDADRDIFNSKDYLS
ncbi:DUF2628 domain-containing protein [Lachnospiraceae bacterium NSJ-143]|nr:DUF2628 domain-containing protein [Lachnospiraceae bacterium NSJ-143]